jgi:hypothetical protein
VAQPDPPSATGPAVHLVGAFPSDGCGVGSDPDCTIATNATLTFRFDRFLNPATVSRQAIHVYTGDPQTGVGSPPFEVAYDPVERVVEYRMPSGYGFEPHALYTLELVVPEAADDFGIRAFDGAPLAEAGLPLKSSFFTGDAPIDIPVPAVPTCAQIVSGVFADNCTGSQCHQRIGHSFKNDGQNIDLGAAPHGLWLDSPPNILATAIGKVARETELGDLSGGTPQVSGARLGVRMALIDPRNPGGSYLMFKLLVGSDNYCPVWSESGECIGVSASTHAFLPLPKGHSVRPTEAELTRLREWFVRGDPMPRPLADGTQHKLILEDLRAVSTFIAGGADCTP